MAYNPRKYYYNNKQEYRLRDKKNRKRMALQIREIKNVPCKDCGKKYPPYVMDFDHRDKTKKICVISGIAKTGMSWEKILKEVAKCDIVCANCHRMRTAKQLGYHKDIKMVD